MVHGTGLLYTTLLSFPISFQDDWSIWFMGQVCYILRYCIFLYLFRVTGLYGSWGRFAIYYATVFCLFLYLFRVTGLYGSWGRFAIYYATVFCLFLYLYRVTGLYGSWSRFAIYICTALLSFPISLQGNWFIWFMGQVCYILRYFLFLYVYRVTGLFGSWDRFAIYCVTVFSYIFTG